jgi:hypothetical protein
MEIDRLENRNVDGNLSLQVIIGKTGCRNVNQILLAKDKVHWHNHGP